MSTTRKRVKSVDIFRAIGIICMVCGHTSMCPQSLSRYFTCFYMPMFFCISGYFYHETTIWNTIKKKARSLLIPYFFTGLLGTIIYYLFYNPEYPVKDAFDALFLHSHKLTTLVSAIWFLTALFWAEIIFTLLKKTRSEIFLGVGCTVLALIGCSMHHFTSFRPVWCLDSAMTSVGFMYIGYLAHKYKNSKVIHRTLNMPWYGIVPLLVINIYMSSYNHISMWGNEYENIPLFWVNGLLGSIIWYNVSRYIDNIKFTEVRWFADRMSYIGNNSIVFLCFNMLILAAYKSIVVSAFGGWPQEPAQRHIWFVVFTVFALLVLMGIAQLNIRRKQLLNHIKQQRLERRHEKNNQ